MPEAPSVRPTSRSTSPDSERSCASFDSCTSGSTGSQSAPSGPFAGYSFFGRQRSTGSESSSTAGGQSSCSSPSGGAGSRMPFFPRSRDHCLVKRVSENSVLDEKVEGTSNLSPPIMQGTLWKVGRHAKMQKTRYFVLRERFLYYYNRQGDKTAKGAIFLDGATISTESHEVPKGKFGLAVQQSNSPEKRVFFCSTEEERAAWLRALTNATRSPSIEDFYQLTDEEVGRGKFAKVVQARSRDDPRAVLAVKVIDILLYLMRTANTSAQKLRY